VDEDKSILNWIWKSKHTGCGKK